MTSQAWKQLERDIAEALGGKRVLRGADFSESAVDVVIPDFPNIKIDAKYRSSPWKHHGPLKECRNKYCVTDVDVALVVTKTGREHGAVVCMSLGDFAGMLDTLRALQPIDSTQRGETSLGSQEVPPTENIGAAGG